jgi:hypothetical protein
MVPAELQRGGLVLSVGVVVVVELSRIVRALSARCVSRVDGIPIRVLSTGETCRLLRGTRVVSVGVVVVVDVEPFAESDVVAPLGGVVGVAALSVC